MSGAAAGLAIRLSGVAVVTGGASGIGAACARTLAAAGATVVVLDRDAARAKAVADDIGGRAYTGDVADEGAMRALAAAIESEVGPVATLVNSAGVIQRPVRPSELDMATWDEIVRVDQRGTYVASIAFAEAMIARRSGAIVNIASIAGSRSMPLHAYAPAKAAVISMTACLAAEWGPAGVRVNAVSPGFTLTPALAAEVAAGRRDVTKLAGNAALGRTVAPEDIANAVAFLVSPLAASITGIDLPVDAGWLAATPWNTYGGLRPPGN